MKNNKLSLWLSIIAIIVAIGFTLWRVTPFEITNDIYIGAIATFIGISVTLLIGYQIYNAIDIKRDISEIRRKSEELDKMIEVQEKAIENQKNKMEEGFDITDGLIAYNKRSPTWNIDAFENFHHALLSSIKTDKAEYEYEWIFRYLRKCISEMNYQNFERFSITSDGRYLCSSFGRNYGRNLTDIIDDYSAGIENVELTIRDHPNFPLIRRPYNEILQKYKHRISAIKENPETQLTPEEKYEITIPR